MNHSPRPLLIKRDRGEGRSPLLTNGRPFDLSLSFCLYQLISRGGTVSVYGILLPPQPLPLANFFKKKVRGSHRNRQVSRGSLGPSFILLGSKSDCQPMDDRPLSLALGRPPSPLDFPKGNWWFEEGGGGMMFGRVIFIITPLSSNTALYFPYSSIF